MTDGPLIGRVRALLSEAEFVRLAEALGGQRIYLPKRLRDDHDLVDAIGLDAAQRLCAAMAPDWLPVPLARREIALHYEALGWKDHAIARKLRMTRKGVQQLLDRAAGDGAGLSDRRTRGSNPNQLKLF